MKIVCINNSDKETLHSAYYKNGKLSGLLTIGKVYETKGGPPAQYHVECDDGTWRFFSMGRFLTIEEYREKKLDEVLK